MSDARLLSKLSLQRRVHTLAAGLQAARGVHVLPESLREHVITAARLHDVGYGYPTTGFHPLDGAAALRDAGYPLIVQCLVAHHTAATYEAQLRGIPAGAFEPYASDQDLALAHALVWWADLTTGPTGLPVKVEARLAEIMTRYPAESIVARFITGSQGLLQVVGQRAEAGIPENLWRAVQLPDGRWTYGQPSYV